jgi:hypothetical protein
LKYLLKIRFAVLGLRKLDTDDEAFSLVGNHS